MQLNGTGSLIAIVGKCFSSVSVIRVNQLSLLFAVFLMQERGIMKEYEFSKKLQQMFEEENRLRHPIAQGLPWTTDFPEASVRS